MPSTLGSVAPRNCLAWASPFVALVYLALQGGGYDPVVAGEVGIAVWWLVLLGAIVGALRPARVGRTGLIAFAILAAFAGWTLLGATWSSSVERSLAEGARATTYAGAFVLALTALAPDVRRSVLDGVACAVVAVASIALLSRLHPAWFPGEETGEFLPGLRNRLSYPLNYWNGLGALVVLGLPLVLRMACAGRTRAGRALATAALPAMVLCGYLTVSRGAALAGGIALVAFLALAPDRLPKLATVALAGGGGALLIAAAHRRPALEDALATAAARDQGDEMLLVTLLVCASVALLHAALSLFARLGGRPAWTSIGPRAAAIVLAVAVVGAAAAGLAAGVPSQVSDRWQEFKRPELSLAEAQRNTSARYGEVSGKGRYQYWQSALDANATHPWRGIGPGTFEYWWARHGSIPSYIRRAHSLYFETLAELGVIGLALIGTFLALVLGTGVARAVRAAPAERTLLAAAAAGCAGWITFAAYDWIWQIPVLPLTMLILAAVILAPPVGARRQKRAPDVFGRVALGLLSAGALVAIAIPLAGASSLRESQRAFDAGDLGRALSEARTAQEVQPSAASPALQEALVLERGGDLDLAAQRARVATTAEPTNWRNWLILARIESKRNRPAAAVAAFRRARSLNPRDPIFRRAR